MLKDSIIALSMRIVGMGLWFLFVVAVARLTSQEEFGRIFYLLSLVQLGSIICQLGFNTVLVREISQAIDRNSRIAVWPIITEAYIFSLIASVVLFAILLLESFFELNFLVLEGGLQLVILIFAIFLLSIANLNTDTLRSIGKLALALTPITILRPVTAFCFLIFTVYIGLESTNSIFFGFMLSLVFCLVFHLYYIFQHVLVVNLFRFPNPRNIGDAISIWPGEVAIEFIARATVLVLGFLGEIEAVALFLAAERISALGQMMLNAIRLAVGPSIAIAHGKGATELQNAVQRTSVLMFTSGLLSAIILAIIAWPLLYAFGSDYIEAYPIIILLIIAQLSWAFFGPTSLTANIIGLGWLRSRLTILLSVILISAQLFISMLDMNLLGIVACYAMVIWILNISLWFLIFIRSGVSTGIIGVKPQVVLGIVYQELKIALSAINGK